MFEVISDTSAPNWRGQGGFGPDRAGRVGGSMEKHSLSVGLFRSSNEIVLVLQSGSSEVLMK
jgi:hypothetical protein